MTSWSELLLEVESYMARYKKALEEIVSFLKLNKDNLRVASNFNHIQEIAQVALDGEPTTADEVNEKRVDYKCENCGSNDIGWDAFAGCENESQKNIKEVDLHNKEIQNHGPPYSMANPSGEPVKPHPLAARFNKKGIQDDPEC